MNEVHTCTRAEVVGALAEYTFVGPDGRREVTIEQLIAAPLPFKEGEKYVITIAPAPKE